MKKRVHKVVVEVVSSIPISEKSAVVALTLIMDQRSCFRRSFSLNNRVYHVRSQLKSFALAAGKIRKEGQLL